MPPAAPRTATLESYDEGQHVSAHVRRAALQLEEWFGGLTLRAEAEKARRWILEANMVNEDAVI